MDSDTRPLINQAEQQVFGSNPFMVESVSLQVGQHHDLARPIGETFKHDLFLMRHPAHYDWLSNLQRRCAYSPSLVA